MRLKFDFAETIVYRLDIELPESVLLSYCEAHGVSMDDVKNNPDLHAYDISVYISIHHEYLGNNMELRESEANIYNAELKV